MQRTNVELLALAVFIFSLLANVASAYTVVLKTGKRIDGVIVSETTQTIQLKDAHGIRYSFKRELLDLQQMALLNSTKEDRVDSQPPRFTINNSNTSSANPFKSATIVKSRQRAFTSSDLERIYGYKSVEPQTYDNFYWLQAQGVEYETASALADYMDEQKFNKHTPNIFGVLNEYLDSPGVVRVRGYFKADGTYVQPHLRTAPDGIPENNFGFPGNYNPNTDQITNGDPMKYLERYYEQSRVVRTEPLVDQNDVEESNHNAAWLTNVLECHTYKDPKARQDCLTQLSISNGNLPAITSSPDVITNRRRSGPTVDAPRRKTGTEICSELYGHDASKGKELWQCIYTLGRN